MDDAALGIQNAPSIVRIAAGAFGFLTLIQAFDGHTRASDGGFQNAVVERKGPGRCRGKQPGLTLLRPLTIELLSYSVLRAARTRPSRTWICKRYPSCFNSCTQSGPN